MVHQVTIDEAERQFATLIDEVAGGAEIVILKDAKPVARIVPALPESGLPQFGSARGLITMSEDFDAPLADFAEYYQAAEVARAIVHS